MKQTIIQVNKEGELAVTTKGYAGASCLEASQPFERLGLVVSDEATEEMYNTNEQIQGVFYDD